MEKGLGCGGQRWEFASKHVVQKGEQRGLLTESSSLCG